MKWMDEDLQIKEEEKKERKKRRKKKKKKKKKERKSIVIKLDVFIIKALLRISSKKHKTE